MFDDNTDGDRSTQSDPLSDGLIHNDRLMLEWHYETQFPETTEVAALVAANERVLRVLAALGERNPEHHEDHAELVSELSRLELKLDLLLDMVGETLHRQINLPQPVPVRLSSRGIEWFTDQLPDYGHMVGIEVYLHAATPRPLRFYGQVEPSRPTGGVRVVFGAGTSREVEDGLEKFIFRQHRRSVASRKLGDS